MTGLIAVGIGAVLVASALAAYSVKYGRDNTVVLLLALPFYARSLLLLAYERIPYVWKSPDMRVRIAVRQLQRQTTGVIDHHLTWNAFPPVVHLVLRTDAEAAALSGETERLVELLRSDLLSSGFRAGDLQRVRVGVVSAAAIDRGGGGFHYWRDRGE